jgi:hypothetical protein
LHSYPVNYDTIEQKINRFVPGIQWNFFANKKIQSYGGLNIPFIKYSTITRNLYGEQRDIATNNLITWSSNRTNIPGGYAVGVGVFAGFNVFLFKHLSLGSEFSTALMYYKVGGESTCTISNQNIPSAIETVIYTTNESYLGTRFTKILSSFNFSIWF